MSLSPPSPPSVASQATSTLSLEQSCLRLTIYIHLQFGANSSQPFLSLYIDFCDIYLLLKLFYNVLKSVTLLRHLRRTCLTAMNEPECMQKSQKFIRYGQFKPSMLLISMLLPWRKTSAGRSSLERYLCTDDARANRLVQHHSYPELADRGLECS